MTQSPMTLLVLLRKLQSIVFTDDVIWWFDSRRSHPGWNDPDMMMFGNAGAHLTTDQATSHLALWAILKAPMLLSTVRFVSAATSDRVLFCLFVAPSYTVGCVYFPQIISSATSENSAIRLTHSFTFR